jgi:hypothetical protein
MKKNKKNFLIGSILVLLAISTWLLCINKKTRTPLSVNGIETIETCNPGDDILVPLIRGKDLYSITAAAPSYLMYTDQQFKFSVFIPGYLTKPSFQYISNICRQDEKKGQSLIQISFSNPHENNEGLDTSLHINISTTTKTTIVVPPPHIGRVNVVDGCYVIGGEQAIVYHPASAEDPSNRDGALFNTFSVIHNGYLYEIHALPEAFIGEKIIGSFKFLN